MSKKLFKCCICSKDFVGYGNNPFPLGEYSSLGESNNRCCNECDMKVTQARIDMLKGLTKEQVQKKYLGKVLKNV